MMTLRFTTADGRSIRKAVEFMLPYADEPAKPWPFAQMKGKHDKPDFNPELRRAVLAYDASAFEAVISNHGGARSKRFQLLFVK